MLGFRATHLVVGTAVMLLFGVCTQVIAFTPQPAPPDRWTVEGFIDLSALTMESTNISLPFGIDPAVIGDGQLDFSAGIIATFAGADRNEDGQPDDAVYAADLQYFRAQIGDTDWDETMPHTGILLQVSDGNVSGMAGNMTCTIPAHPDLEFWLPASPGAWEARDERDGHNAGTIAGTYALRDGAVPEPGTPSLLAVGALILIRRRRK